MFIFEPPESVAIVLTSIKQNTLSAIANFHTFQSITEGKHSVQQPMRPSIEVFKEVLYKMMSSRKGTQTWIRYLLMSKCACSAR